MPMNIKNSNSQLLTPEAAEYGEALLSNRGGWTLREILGSDYQKFSDMNQIKTDDSTYQKSPKQPEYKLKKNEEK
jgi:hypothetical protein